MYFKEIKLAGFKSFADKIEIKFDDGITAIVGPNGCGKSNVADAIRWVLGEQSSKTLRGGSMQDVIFNGTERRKSVSYCEVSLYFNNTDHFFNFEYDDLIITRKLYRSGESAYLINHNPCRLKDIVNLFYDSGIGKDGYSIIGQGKVEEILSNKPEARRAVFEEAAGIAKFKSQKVESERKLERTEERLVRLRDIVGELERQIGPLKKQAETAKIYLEFRDLLKDLEVNAFIYQNENLGEERRKIGIKLDGILQEISLKEAELVGLGQQSNNCLEEISSIDNVIKQLSNEILILTVGMEKQAGEAKLLQERITHYREQNQKLDLDIVNYNNLLLKSHAEEEFKSKRRAELEARAKVIEESSGEYATLLKEFSTLKADEIRLATTLKESESSFNDIKSKIMVFENRKRLLLEMQQEYEGYAYAVKKLLKEAERNMAVSKKIVGVLASLVKVPAKYETAIEVALGASLQNIVTENEINAKELIYFLKDNGYGRATFLPITSMKPRHISENDKKTLATKGCFGVASGLISYDKKIDNVIQNLLGSTVIVDTLETAVSMAQNSKFSFKIVTLEGDVVNPTGSLTGGSKKSNNTNLISREREIETLTQNINELKIEYNEKLNLIKSCENELGQTRERLEELNTKKNSTELTEAVQIAEIRTEINSLNQDFERIKNSINETNASLKMATELVAKNNEYIEREQEKVDQIFKSSENIETQEKLNAIKKKQDEQDIEKLRIQERMRQIDAQKEGVMGEINSAAERKYKAESELNKLETDLQTLAERIHEEYGLEYPNCLQFKREDFDFVGAKPEILRLKKEIQKLGNVNVNAIEDIKVIYERYDELSTQLNDLEQSKADTLQAISELSAEMSQIFEEKFNQINENFKVTFKELFGGGHAHLELVGSDNILEAGIEINANPPGKKLSGLSPMSGGEKALTAIAILFAILKLKPMPFCLLDEIEAALDDANVERFAQYLHRFSGNTQFIVITHRKPTMELADSLYGVTMEEKGVSKVVSVKLSEAIKNAKEA